MTTRNWHFSEQTQANLLEISPLLAQLLVQRGIKTPDQARAFLDPQHYVPAPPAELPDLKNAAALLGNAVTQGTRILVWGDFDVDGQTATALLVSALRQMGADVVYYIPHRLRESHGILVPSLRQQLDEHNPGLLLTCDTGVSAHEAVDYTKQRGLTAIITDHHDLPPTLPSADAVVNPKRLPDEHPLASLPGVGVAYKLIEHMRSDQAAEYLDLVALGIVADVATLTHDTRYLLQTGLKRLQNTTRPGLQALIDVAGLDRHALVAEDIGFQIGPRLNAAGRLDDARLAVELLTTTDESRAHVLALQLDGLNTQRRLTNRQILDAVQEQISREPDLLQWEALVLGHPAWHPGILGVVASRLADQYQRPVVLLNTADQARARGSARSAPGYDIGAAIAAQADMLLSHGGHPGAAGLSLPANDIPAFRRRLSDTLRATRDPDYEAVLAIDAKVEWDAVTLELAHELDQLAPFGEGNPRPVLAAEGLTIKSSAYLDRARQHRRLTIDDANGVRNSVIWWNSANDTSPEHVIDLAFEVQISTFHGPEELQLVLVDHRPSVTAPPPEIRPARTVIDYRDATRPAARLDELRTDYPDAVVWAEGYRRADSPGVPLHELSEAETLVVYTPPASPQALHDALERVQAVRVALFAVDPPFRTLTDVLKQLGGLVRYVVHEQAGRTTLHELAGALALTPQTVRAALDTFAARGDLAATYKRGGGVMISLENPPPPGDIEAALTTLQNRLAETDAYRAFYKRATAEKLVEDS